MTDDSRKSRLRAVIKLPEDGAQIPRVVHSVWLDKKDSSRGPPQSYQNDNFLGRWKKHNPHWEHRSWTLDMVRQLITDHPELERFRHFLEDTIPMHAWISKCDIARLLILYVFGGLYADLDVQCHKPLDPLIQGRSMLLIHDWVHMPALSWLVSKRVGDPAIFNGIMGGAPRQPFFFDLLVFLQSRYEAGPDCGSVVEVLRLTGPYALGRFAVMHHIYDEKAFPELYVEKCLLMPTTMGKPIAECAGIEPYMSADWNNGTKWQLDPSQILANCKFVIRTWHVYLLILLVVIGLIVTILAVCRGRYLKQCEVKRLQCEQTCPMPAPATSASKRISLAEAVARSRSAASPVVV